MISMFHKEYPEKPTVTSPPLNFALPIAKPSVKHAKPSSKQKHGRLTGWTKEAKEWDIGQWGFSFPVLVKLEGFFTNFVGFRKDAHSVSSSNSASFYLWVVHRYCACCLWAAYCHCACHLWAAHRHYALYLWAAYCHHSSDFSLQSPIRLGGFSSNWSLGFLLQFSTRLRNFSSTLLYQALPLYVYTLSRACILEERQL